jgi:hypothetical protein
MTPILAEERAIAKHFTGLSLAGKITATVVTPAATILLLGPGLAARAGVLVLLWRWYLTPLGLEPIAFGVAFGVALIFSLLTNRQRLKNSNPEDRSVWALWFGSVGAPLVFLFVGWAGTFVF